MVEEQRLIELKFTDLNLVQYQSIILIKIQCTLNCLWHTTANSML